MLVTIIVLAVVVAAVLYQRGKQRAPVAHHDLQAGMKQVAEDAVRVARESYAVTLDYSPESVERVEAILAKLHEEHLRSPFDLTREKDEGGRWGAYIGEVILRMAPGHWEMDHVAGGKGSFPVRVGRGDSFPIGWCRKRILKGPEDNVWHKFQILYLQESSGTSFTPPSR